MRDVLVPREAPGFSDLLEGQVPAIAEGDVGEAQRREAENPLPPVHRPHPLRRVLVHRVVEVPGPNEQVLEPVEIDVHERGPPGPAGRVDAGELRGLRPGPVPPTQVERVARLLRPVPQPSRELRVGDPADDLLHAQPLLPAQHLHDEEVRDAVPVHVRKIHAHRGEARAPHGERRQHPEAPGPVVDPDVIGAVEVVTDVQVGIPVTVHVLETGREPPLQRFRLQRPARLVEERALRPWHRREPSRPVVQVKAVGLREFEPGHHPLLDLAEREVFPPFGQDLESVLRLPVDVARLKDVGWEEVLNGRDLVVHDVQVEVPVPVDVGERDRHASERRREPRLLRPVREMARPVVHVECVGSSERVDQEVEVSVSVHIREHGARREAVLRRDSRLLGDVLEAPAAQVPVEPVRPIHPCKIEVDATVTVRVPRRDAGPVQVVAVLDVLLFRHHVLERDPGLRRVESFESRLVVPRHPKLGPAVPVLLDPVERPRPARAAECRRREQCAADEGPGVLMKLGHAPREGSGSTRSAVHETQRASALYHITCPCRGNAYPRSPEPGEEEVT